VADYRGALKEQERREGMRAVKYALEERKEEG
jgi:hypothetical protein